MKKKPSKCPAPFGVATKRFAKIGFHPELDISGAMKREITKVGPGSYDVKIIKCRSKKGFQWKNQVESEDFSKNLGYRNLNVLYERRFNETLRGPGTNDINENLYKRQSCLVQENCGFGLSKKIEENFQNFPPSNLYFKHLTSKFEFTNHTFSKTPIYASRTERFKSELKSYHLPSNIYKKTDNKNTADIIKKTVSLRGPYDCFTGPRDGSTIKNYFSPPSTSSPDYFYIKPSDLDYLLKHPTKKRCGFFLKSNRSPKKPTLRTMLNDLTLCYKDPNAPGPANYDLSNLYGIKIAKKSIHPFNSSNQNARPPINWQLSPGPGRYNVKMPKCMKEKRPSWVFLTKCDRQLFKAVDDYRFCS